MPDTNPNGDAPVVATAPKLRLQAVKTKLEENKKELAVTFLKPPTWNDQMKFKYRFVHTQDGTEKPEQEAPNVAEEKKDNNETGNLTFTLTEAEIQKSSIAATKAGMKDWLLQLKPKEAAGKEMYEWVTEVNLYYMARLDIELFQADVPLVAESDNPEYKILKPVVVEYKNVKAQYETLPDTWPNGDKIESRVVLHELDYHTTKKTFNFAIEAEIGWEIVGGVKVKRAGFELRMRDTTPQEYKTQKQAREAERRAAIDAEKTKLLALTAPKQEAQPVTQ